MVRVSKAKLLHRVRTMRALHAYCARRGRDTHPRIPVTCLVARRSSKAHMRKTKLPSTWYSTVPMNKPLSLVRYPHPPVSFPTPGKTVPHHPLGDGHQVTVPHPPLGDHTPTVHAHLQARSYEMRRYASPCPECPTTCAKTGSPVERMNITLVPGGNMVVLSSSISAKVSKMSCHECKGCKW